MNEIEISSSQARELTDRIRVGVEAVWELVKQAYQSRAWSVLGYDSWDDYCTREFGTSRIRLPREERQEVVASMREIGMSQRAIASATGASQSSVQRELASDPNGSVAEVTGVNGKTYTPKPRPEPVPEPEPTEDDEQEPPVWEDVGQIPPSRLKNLHPAPGIPADDLEELNTPPVDQPTPEPVAAPADDPRDHLLDLMTHVRKAEKELKEAVIVANRIHTWDGDTVSQPLRELLDALDSALIGGGIDGELIRLLKGNDS